jgi:hypothetical protein
VNALIDSAARDGIAVLAWTVPRAASYEDLSLSVAAASYKTPAGNRLAGLAIDLERGAEYLGDGPSGSAAIAKYARLVRSALGKSAIIVATIEDPFLKKLTNKGHREFEWVLGRNYLG